jgi:hypothetical protein
MNMSERAIQECVVEIRAACRRPIDEAALQRLLDWVRPNFRDVLDGPEGKARWTEHGRLIRDNGRYLGALADFFSHQADVDVVGANQLTQAFAMVESACRVGAPPEVDPHAVRTAVHVHPPV